MYKSHANQKICEKLKEELELNPLSIERKPSAYEKYYEIHADERKQYYKEHYRKNKEERQKYYKEYYARKKAEKGE